MNRSLKQLMTGAFLLWFSVYTYPAFLSAYASALGATPVMVGAVIGSYGFTQMLLRIPLGIFSDAIGRRKPFLIGGMIAAILSGVGLATVKTPAGALFFRAMAGVAVSTWVAHTAMYSSLFSLEQTAGAMGRLTAAQYAAHVAAMLLGGLAAQALSREVAFLLGALAACAGLAVVWGIQEERADKPASFVPLSSVVFDRTLLLSTLLATVFQFASWGTVLGFSVNWASEVVGLAPSQLGLLSATFLLTNTIISRASGFLTAKYGQTRILCAGFALCAAACAAFSVSYHAPLLFFTQALFGVGMGLILPITFTGAILNIPPEKRGVAMGFYQSIYGVGMFLGPILAGSIVAAFGYRANFFAMAGICLIGALLAPLWRRVTTATSQARPTA
jgi:MFS family permease